MSAPQNGQKTSAPDARRDPEEVRDELDVYNRVTRPAASSPEFQETNYGLGYYANDTELYRQNESFKAAMYGRAAFGPAIRARAEHQAKEAFLRETFRTTEAHTDKDFEDWRERNEDRWEDLTDQQRLEKIRKHTRINPDWRPPQERMAEMRLETSRGRDAQLLDNVFGRVVKKITEGGEAAKEKLGGLGRKQR